MNKPLLSTMLFLDKLVTLLTEKNHLHTSRFAYPHEVAPLMKNTIYPASLLLGVSYYKQILQVTATPKRRELGNILVVGRPRAGKGLLAIPQLLSWRHSVNSEFFADSWSSLTSELDALLAESAVRSFTGSDFTMEELMCGERPKTVYLRLTEEDLDVLSPLIKLSWTAWINGLTSTHDNRNGVGCNPVLLLIDEAAATNIPKLPEYTATVTGRGVSLWIAVQDLSQLEDTHIYGKDRAKALRNNCDTHIYYRPNDLETAEYIERRLGKKSDYAASRHTQEGKETSQGQSEQGVPLMTAQEVMEMKDDQVIVTHRDLKPMRAKRMNWLEFPELVRRTKIPMPDMPVLPPLPPLPTVPPAKTDLPPPRQDLSEDRQDGEDGQEKPVNGNNGLDGDAGFINPNIYTLEDEVFIANRPSTEATVIEDHVENTAKEVTTIWESKNGIVGNHQENNRKKI